MSTGANTRERILDAAKEVLLEKGIVRATTKEIARAAGVSEGTLYNHFRNKEQIFLAAMFERLPNFIPLVISFCKRAGSGTVEGNLRELLQAGIPFYLESIPMGSSVLADPGLHSELRAELRERGGGPHKANELLAMYLQAEQELGRVRSDVSPEAIAYLLLGGCYQYANWVTFLKGDAEFTSPNQLIDDMLAIVLPQILPTS